MSDVTPVHTDNAPQAIGPYSQAVVSDGWVFCSGQIPLDPSTMELLNGTVAEQTDLVLKNLRAVLEAGGSAMDRVLRTTVYLVDLSLFPRVNEVYGRHFVREPQPARVTVQAAGLPLGADIEIDAVAAVEDPSSGDD